MLVGTVASAAPAHTIERVIGSRTDEFVKSYIAEMTGKAMDLDRLVTEPSPLSTAEMIEAFSHPDLGRLGITLMTDCMAPEGSIYYDAVFGAHRGQRAIRGWLLPAMADIDPSTSCRRVRPSPSTTAKAGHRSTNGKWS